ncbi:winged helix-turn-helix transcriptional regulator [Halomonas organivorans]|uniref:DNA-binding HxlR family transcriptional regulator n=1 Tax=Halomonas organivorans TaxID=257772 RepID=A0A7W5C133_9GAMM|nr:helix-turn-helix domain-containing protein [Halomonas organivorans]MBB3142702.1 DNA-binding HxlR family transcriptional regulator [Halomonas organivorans]
MDKGYGQFCPVAKAAEIVAERWTPLVMRELLCGSQHFNDLRRGVPRMSPSLLSQRLKRLEDQGLVERFALPGGGSAYRLTAAGEALRPVIEALGAWGKRWVSQHASREDLDPDLLMWDLHRRLHLDRLPTGRTVLRFEFLDMPARQRFYWLLLEAERVDVCFKDPGFDVDLQVAVPLAVMTAIWLGDRSVERARRDGDLTLHGPRSLRQSFAGWLRLSSFAEVPRAGTRQ